MSLMDNGSNGMIMPVSPMYGGNGGGGFGYGGYGDGLFWIIILFLFAAMNGNGWGGFAGNGGGALPFMLNQNTQNDVQRVVDQQSVMTGISALSAAQANGFANAEISRCNGIYNLTSQLNTIAMNQQNCCCENRAAVADLKYTMAQEAAATRANTDAKVQTVLDKLCQLEMDGIKQNYENRISGLQNTIDSLRSALNDANGQASQNLQTAQLMADNAAQTAALEQYLAPTPRPAYIVSNPNCCQQTFGCGCGAA